MATYSQETARLWMAMDIGPLWIGRDDDDPLSPASIAADSTKNEVREPQSQTVEQTAVAKPQPHTFLLEQTPSAAEKPKRGTAGSISPEYHHQKNYELKPIRRTFADPGIVEVDSDLLTQAQTADWKTLESLVARCTACRALTQSRLSTVFGTAQRTAKMVIGIT